MPGTTPTGCRRPTAVQGPSADVATRNQRKSLTFLELAGGLERGRAIPAAPSVNRFVGQAEHTHKARRP